MAFYSLQRIVVIALLLSIHLLTYAEVLIGKVVGVSDGDTITVLDATKTEHKVRLMGIDAPEKSQDFGNQSKRALSNYIYQQEIAIEYKKLDKYKRKVGKVIFEGKDVCLQMIELGMAWHYKEYEKEQSKIDSDLYSQAELKARIERRGLWQTSNPIAPSTFRSLAKRNGKRNSE
ncbi:thermonuclease family protein [Limnohabitans sp. Hippo4]|uniref:thermonuclease family protein n=1 Tax=Limnohabitans sp. Hippo4 TaxID=1826167 RepID=UPI000D3BEB5B|nr:thermonuclease family protein [Limnohabitans sp. Hippo4]PUE35595.1 hypothetical protein B9Z46_10835 [Limnohabitans sp. Hippo4]